MSEDRKPPRSGRGRAAALMLAALAVAVTACGFAGGGTVNPAGTCDNFVTTVRAGEPGYVPGQPVIISVTQANEGPACDGTPPEWCGNLQAFATVYNAAGEDVWDYGASKTIPGQATCPFAAAPGPAWPAHYANTQKLTWRQDRCATADATGQPGQPNGNCPGTQVPAGTCRIVGNGTSAPVTVSVR
jgi:hypothetical protein